MSGEQSPGMTSPTRPRALAQRSQKPSSLTSPVKGFSQAPCSRLSKAERVSARSRCDIAQTSEKGVRPSARSRVPMTARLRPPGESKTRCTRRNSIAAVEKVLGSMALP